MSAIWKRLEEKDEGFTLIELLVVVIIIGILAAIAIPVFLNQRERAWQAELTSDVRNVALSIEAEATANGGAYPAAADVDLGALNPGANTTLADYSVNGTASQFCFVGTHGNITGTHSVGYSSADNGLQPYQEAAYDCTDGVLTTP